MMLIMISVINRMRDKKKWVIGKIIKTYKKHIASLTSDSLYIASRWEQAEKLKHIVAVRLVEQASIKGKKNAKDVIKH